jgi:2-methylcitrate dehydratase PrpD
VDVIKKLVENVVSTRFENLPDAAVEAVKKSVLDILGVAFAGAGAAGCKSLLELALEWRGKQESTVFCYGDRLPVHYAAMLNSCMARAVDLDDIHDKAVLHASTSIVPSAFAMAERVGGLSGKDFITAICLGVDLICRLGLSIKVSPLITGMSITWQMATFGAAAVAGKIIGLDESRMLNAMGNAYSMTSGNQQTLLDGALMIRVQQGIASANGILSSLLAERGITGARNVLEGKFGYYKVYQGGAYDPEMLTRELGKKFEGINVAIKSFPSCYETHPAITGTIDLVKEHDLEPEDIREILVRLNQGSYNLVCDPLQKKSKPQTVPEAQFSLPYTVAVAAAKRDVFLGDFSEEAIRDQAILELAAKVRALVDPEIEATSAREIGPAFVEIGTKNGKRYSKFVSPSMVKGHAGNPMKVEEVAEKFRKCIPFGIKPLSEENVREVTNFVAHLEDWEDVTRLLKFL